MQALHSNTILPHFSICMNGLTEFWHSPPFYSDTQGYKLRLVLRTPIRYLTGTYRVFCQLELLPGEHDDILEWPLNITVQLNIVCHQNKENNSDEVVLEINEAKKPSTNQQLSKEHLLGTVKLHRHLIVNSFFVSYSADIAVVGVNVSSCHQ